MIGGEAATRIMHEVLRGKTYSGHDTEEEREYRESIKRSVEKMREDGAGVDIQKEWP
jgi:hypothetical protein